MHATMKFASAAILAVSVQGATIWFEDRTAWLNAVKNVQTIDFEGLAPSTYTTSAGVTLGAVRFSSPQERMACGFSFQTGVSCTTTNYYEVKIVDDPAGQPPLNGAYLTTPNRSAGTAIGPVPGGYNRGTLILDFGAGKTAAGWDYNAGGDALTINLNNGTASPFNPNLNGFVGFISSQAVTQASMVIPAFFLPMSGGHGFLRIDNVSTGDAVPEPGTWMLGAGGLLVIASRTRGKSR
ncbi:MAG: hypothetical protein FJW30_05520 [Acidobacteria bacterium]|nr:hypothetical protein [Acidobacteriota bacterium]